MGPLLQVRTKNYWSTPVRKRRKSIFFTADTEIHKKYWDSGHVKVFFLNIIFISAKSTPRQVRSATLSGGERRISLPNGANYSSSTMGRATSEAPRFRHYGSSLSLAEGHGKHELTSRTLR